MRINRDILLKIADDTVLQHTRKERGILAIYLSGALLGDDVLLGGTADVDLTFIHLDTPPHEREVQRLSDDVHLDIAHYDQRDFRQVRSLRLHPWLGPILFECKILYDPQHFMDFTQASVRGQFNRPDYVLRRASSQLEHARQIWQGLSSQTPAEPGPKEVSAYLRAVEHAANAVASLNGQPLTERRLLLNFPARAEAVNRQDLYPALLGVLGALQVEAAAVVTWIPAWMASMNAIVDVVPQEAQPPRLHPCRQAYYRRAVEALLASDRPAAALWPLLHTWTQSACLLPAVSPGREAWQAACTKLGLLGSGFSLHLEALDAFLDSVEETLEDWSRQQGG